MAGLVLGMLCTGHQKFRTENPAGSEVCSPLHMLLETGSRSLPKIIETNERSQMTSNTMGMQERTLHSSDREHQRMD